ncbi:MAG: tetratricopeptide repeat protein [Verrucomicrobia bacterium]|nr:tetratricopeptide repeat protein [Verrucomicrobiota bacterium]
MSRHCPTSLFLLWFIASALWVGTAMPATATPAEDFEAANKLYEQGSYEDAAKLFGNIATNGLTSPELCFNRGNAFFKAGQLGRAISAYRAAERLSPRDSDIRANLRFAREQVREPKWQPGRIANTIGTLTLNEWAVLTMIPAWAFFLLLATGQWRPSLAPSLRIYILSSAILAICFGSGLAANWNLIHSTRIVSATANDLAIRHGPLEESQTSFTVQDGTELQITDSKGDWLEVRTDDRHSGWVRKTQVAP